MEPFENRIDAHMPQRHSLILSGKGERRGGAGGRLVGGRGGGLLSTRAAAHTPSHLSEPFAAFIQFQKSLNVQYL